LNPHDYGTQTNAGQPNYDALSLAHNALLLGRNRSCAVIETPSSEHPLLFHHASSSTYFDPRKLRTQPAKSAPEAPKTAQKGATTAPRSPRERPCFQHVLQIPHSRLPDAPKQFKRLPRSPQDGPRGPQDGPTTAQESPRTPNRPPRGPRVVNHEPTTNFEETSDPCTYLSSTTWGMQATYFPWYFPGTTPGTRTTCLKCYFIARSGRVLRSSDSSLEPQSSVLKTVFGAHNRHCQISKEASRNSSGTCRMAFEACSRRASSCPRQVPLEACERHASSGA